MKYWFKYTFDWMRVYNSPFKPIMPKLYIGKVAIGTPYFFPRVWVKATPKLAHEATKKHIEREETYNKLNPKYARKIKPYNEIFEDKMNGSYPVPKKIGFNFVPLGWKTKYDSYRHEWNPMWSFVFFKWQIALLFVPKHDMHYWECWLYYTRETDKTKSIKDRIEEAKRQNPCIWITSKNGIEKEICYWDLILKDKYYGKI